MHFARLRVATEFGEQEVTVRPGKGRIKDINPLDNNKVDLTYEISSPLLPEPHRKKLTYRIHDLTEFACMLRVMKGMANVGIDLLVDTDGEVIGFKNREEPEVILFEHALPEP